MQDKPLIVTHPIKLDDPGSIMNHTVSFPRKIILPMIRDINKKRMEKEKEKKSGFLL